MVWRDGRENPDTASVVFTYPQGFVHTYTTRFGNSYRSFSRIQGTDGTIDNFGGEGASLFLLTKEGGPHEPDPAGNIAKPRYLAPPGMGLAEDRAEIVKAACAPADSIGPNDDDANHLRDWLDAMRSRKQPSATVDHGFSHSIACMNGGAVVLEGRAHVLGCRPGRDCGSSKSVNRDSQRSCHLRRADRLPHVPDVCSALCTSSPPHNKVRR
jgi:hypothetical protein